MNALELRIWDVNHGDSLTFKTPLDKFFMIDCARNPRTGFSPVVGTRKWIHKISPDVKLVTKYKPTRIYVDGANPVFIRSLRLWDRELTTIM
jgi:hypothetical protein